MYTQVYKAPSLWPQNQRYYVMRSATFHKTSWMYIDFWKWGVSKHSDSTEATRGWSMVSHAFQRADQLCLSLIFLKFMVGATRFALGAPKPLAPSWLGACQQRSSRHYEIALRSTTPDSSTLLRCITTPFSSRYDWSFHACNSST
jgi:hypothetical protein